MFGVFILAIKFDCLFLGIFKSFLLICDFKFWEITPFPHWINVSKDAFNHVLVKSSAKNNFRRAKNVVFFLFCILVDRPNGGGYAPPPWLRYCVYKILKDAQKFRKIKKDLSFFFLKVFDERRFWQILTLLKILILFWPIHPIKNNSWANKTNFSISLTM